MERRQDHRIEFQPLGLVNGHDLHGGVVIYARLAVTGEQFFYTRIKLFKIDDVAAAGLRLCFCFKQIQHLLSVVEIARCRQAGGTA